MERVNSEASKYTEISMVNRETWRSYFPLIVGSFILCLCICLCCCASDTSFDAASSSISNFDMKYYRNMDIATNLTIVHSDPVVGSKSTFETESESMPRPGNNHSDMTSKIVIPPKSMELRESRNYLQSDRKTQILEDMVHNLQRELIKMRDNLDSTARRMRELEIGQEEALKRPTPTPLSPIPTFNKEDAKTRKLVNRLHFSDKCGGLVELSEVSELSYVRPSNLDDYNDGPETCVWVVVTSTHNQIGLTLRGLEPSRGDSSDTYGLSTQIMDAFPKPQIKSLEARDVDREYVAPSSEVVIIFSTANSTRINQGFRLGLRNVDKRKTTWQVTVHTEWNCLGEKTTQNRDLRYPFGGGNYGNQTSVYFIFHPGTSKRVWFSVDFPRIPNYQSKLSMYKYSAEHQEFRQLAKLARFPNPGSNYNSYSLSPVVDAGDGSSALPEDRQYVGNPSQPVLLHLYSPSGGWGEGFTISFSYHHA